MRIDEIGAEVKRIRKECKVTQCKLSAMSGYTEQHINHVENQRGYFSVLSLCSILDALGYELEFKKKSDN